MRERHWNLLIAKVGTSFDANSEDFTLEAL